MPRVSSGRVLTLLVLLAAWQARGRADEPENWKRLEAIPLEERLQLAENLDRFDAIESNEKAAIRRLDESIAKLDPSLQGRYRSLIRNYHVWVSGLDDAKKQQLAKTPPGEKLALVTRWRKEEREASERTKSNLILGVHAGDLGAIPPFEMANALRVWLQIDEKERAQIEAAGPVPRRLAELIRLGLRKKISMQRFPANEETIYLERLESDDRLKLIFPQYFRRQEKVDPLLTPAKKKVEFRGAGLAQPLHHLAESLYFVEHPPAPVSSANLLRFDTQLPAWFRASLDPLSPDDARRRLTILYRQIYPHPTEMPPPKPLTNKPPPPPAPKAAPPKAGEPTTQF